MGKPFETIEIIVENLKRDVSSAESARLNGDHQAVDRLFTKWTRGNRSAISYSSLSEHITAETDYKKLDPFALIAIGILGLARIQAVDITSRITPDISENERVEILNAWMEANLVFSKLQQAHSIPYTIDGNPIYWQIEIYQDQGNLQTKLGETQKAVENFDKAIEIANSLCSEEKNIHAKSGILSGLAVNQVRLGRLTKNQRSIFYGLINQMRSNRQRYNADRTAVLGQWALQSAVMNWKKSVAITDIFDSTFYRVSNLILGLFISLKMQIKKHKA